MIETEMASRKMIGAEEKLLDSLLIEERWRRRDVIGRLRHLLERPGNPLSLYHRSVVQTDKRNWEKICRRNTRNRTHSGRNVMVTIAQHFAGENNKKCLNFISLRFHWNSKMMINNSDSIWYAGTVSSSSSGIFQDGQEKARLARGWISTSGWTLYIRHRGNTPAAPTTEWRRKYVWKESYWRFCWIENIFLYIEHII